MEEKLPKLKSCLKDYDGQEAGVKRWVGMIHSYLAVEHLDRNLARALIDGITVSARYKQDGKYTQDIIITYRFVGNLQKLTDKTKDVA